MPHQHRAFTLIELLVSIAIGMVVMALAIGAYQNSQKLIKNAEAMVRLHRSAGDIAQQWQLDSSALMQHVACNTTTTYAASIKSLVQFTGMVTVAETFTGDKYDYPYDTDAAWVRWEWKASERKLTRAISPPPHWDVWYPKEDLAYFDIGPSHLPSPVIGMRANPVRTYNEFLTGYKLWHNPLSAAPGSPTRTRIYDLLFLTGTDYNGSHVYYDPVVTLGCGQGITEEIGLNSLGRNLNTGGSPVAASDNNILSEHYYNPTPTAASWATLPVPDQRRPLADDVTECAISLETRAGDPFSDSGSGLNASFDAESQDGLGNRGNRPSILRLSFTLTDRRTGVSQSFSFSAKAP